MSLGRARSGLEEFAAAQTNLLEAQSILVKVPGPKDEGTRKSTQYVVDLYTAWSKAEPGKGNDAKAAEWKQKLDALGPAATVH